MVTYLVTFCIHKRPRDSNYNYNYNYNQINGKVPACV